jgi:hypothetical protein
MACRRCGAELTETVVTVPYVTPGPFVVQLSNLPVLRCLVCGDLQMHVPQPQVLDILARCLALEAPDKTPLLSFDDGRWRVVAR